MALADYFQFENPEVIAILIGALAFIFALTIIRSFMPEKKGVAITAAAVIGLFTSWRLYTTYYVIESTHLAFALFALAVVLIVFGSKRQQKGAATVGILFGIIGVWVLMQDRLFEYEGILAVVILIVVLAVLFKIIAPFGKGIKNNFRY